MWPCLHEMGLCFDTGKGVATSWVWLIAPSKKSMWKWMFRLRARPDRWIRMTGPVLACLLEKPALFTMWIEMARWIIPITLLNSLGYLANNNRRGIGKLSTHWRTGQPSKTSSTNNAALSAILLAPQLGQKPLRLQLNATKFSSLQSSQTTRKNLFSSRPQCKNSSNSR